MHIMEFPNRKGIDCSVKLRVLKIPYYTFGANAYYPNYRLGPVDGSACDTLGIDNMPVALFRQDLEDTLAPLQPHCTDLSYYEPASWAWDFGDGFTSTDTSPVHIFPVAGSYNVCLTVSNDNGADTFCSVVQVGTVGVQQLPVLLKARVSPNPFGSVLRITLPALIDEKPLFRLFDLFGREMLVRRLSDFETELDTQRLPPGVYSWQLSYRGGVTQTGKVVKA